MPKKPSGFAETKHTTFSLYPSQIQTFRQMAGPFGSVGRAMQVAVEVLYDRLQRNKKDLIDVEEWCPTELTGNPEPKELKAPMSCDLLKRTNDLINWLADSKRYGSRYMVMVAAGAWLTEAHSDKRKKEMKSFLEEQRRADEKAGGGPRTDLSKQYL